MNHRTGEEDSMPRIIVPLASGFEEIEAVTVIDLLRRAGVEVVTAGLGGTDITGSHGITVRCEAQVDDCEAGPADGIVLPGGMPGSTHLAESEAVGRLVREICRAGKLTAAICAAPGVLAEFGVLEDKTVTSHPSVAATLKRFQYSEKPVVIDGNIITSRGAGTAIAFSAALIGMLVGQTEADKILKSIIAV
jgi:4-methyl-5(b-hydroxyethyl)-thiazole monophosphate biosynthesis